MTTERLKENIRAWITSQVSNHAALTGIPIVLSGETEEAEFPLVVIVDQGSEVFDQGGIIMRGVDTVTLTVEIHSVPAEVDQNGTVIAEHDAITTAVYHCLADSNARAYMDSLNGLRLFDFRVSSPTMSADEPRRHSIIQITAVACPNL